MKVLLKDIASLIIIIGIYQTKKFQVVVQQIFPDDANLKIAGV
jgi:hypothetical protein